MDEKYIKEFTSNWELQSSNGNVELWDFHDQVEWRTKFAIKIDGVVKASIDKDEGNPYKIFEIVCKCI